MYTVRNYRTKASLKADVKAGLQVEVYDNSLYASGNPPQGMVYLAGPHYPEAHKWYASAVVVDGIIQSVK